VLKSIQSTVVRRSEVCVVRRSYCSVILKGVDNEKVRRTNRCSSATPHAIVSSNSKVEAPNPKPHQYVLNLSANNTPVLVPNEKRFQQRGLKF